MPSLHSQNTLMQFFSFQGVLYFNSQTIFCLYVCFTFCMKHAGKLSTVLKPQDIFMPSLFGNERAYPKPFFKIGPQHSVQTIIVAGDRLTQTFIKNHPSNDDNLNSIVFFMFSLSNTYHQTHASCADLLVRWYQVWIARSWSECSSAYESK